MLPALAANTVACKSLSCFPPWVLWPCGSCLDECSHRVGLLPALAIMAKSCPGSYLVYAQAKGRKSRKLCKKFTTPFFTFFCKQPRTPPVWPSPDKQEIVPLVYKFGNFTFLYCSVSRLCTPLRFPCFHIALAPALPLLRPRDLWAGAPLGSVANIL
eukprot:GHVT01054489.1.p1 GENE.GHVT01054489.1~~GHVT01054489.1.p1  ORF type:complete len:157 (+),score=6.08 GHVT01054489.1:755-1225(+)